MAKLPQHLRRFARADGVAHRRGATPHLALCGAQLPDPAPANLRCGEQVCPTCTRLANACHRTTRDHRTRRRVDEHRTVQAACPPQATLTRRELELETAEERNRRLRRKVGVIPMGALFG